MVILDLPIPSGFSLETSGLDVLKEAGTIAKYQVTPRNVIVYLRDLGTKDPLMLQYQLKATMPVKVAVPPAEVYEYYRPELRGKSEAAVLSAT